ncbi:MAG: linear amide C-N hydrolase, partial [Candidatus Avispirillum sp.]
DKNGAITVESVKEGIKIYDNPVGVLTNNPPFDEQMFNLNNYMHLSPKSPENTFAPSLGLRTYSRGMGALGLPGDLSSQSRFVRVAFTKMNSVSGSSESESVSQFFHILGSVDQQRGCCDVGEGKYEITIYTSCCNADKGIYYYTTYENHQITGVDMHRENLDGVELIRYPLLSGESIKMQN